MWEHGKKVATYKLWRKLLLEPLPAGTLISVFQLTDLWEINSYYLSYPICGILLWQQKQTKTVVD